MLPNKLRSTACLAGSLVCVALVGCGNGTDGPPPEGPAVNVDPTTLAYAPALGIDFAEMERIPAGVHIREDLPGTGEEAASGRAVTVHYTGYHPDGTVFDSSRDREPFTVVLGAGQVIPGWDHGIPGMREGGRRTLVIPPELAYGAQGAGGGVIPPNAVLVFEVELLQVH